MSARPLYCVGEPVDDQPVAQKSGQEARPDHQDRNAQRQAAYRQRKRRKRGPVILWHKSDEWETPIQLFAALDSEFHFLIDVAALPHNAKCARFYTPAQNGLKQNWHGVRCMNPPYGSMLLQWVKKAFHSAKAGATTVCLLPAGTDTFWWHEYVLPHAEIRYLRGRLAFNATGRATFHSVVVVFRPVLQNG